MSNKAGDMDGHRVSFNLAGSGADETVAHDLGRTPIEGFVLVRTSSGNVYRGTTAWTSTQIFLRASTGVSGILFLI